MNTSRKKNGGKKRSIGIYTDSRGRKRPVTPRVATVTIIIPGHDAVRHEKEWETEGHWELRNGERIWIPEHENRAEEGRYHVSAHEIRRKVIRYAGGFKTLAKKITEEYKKKGVPPKEAEKFGVETASDIYRDKMAADYER